MINRFVNLAVGQMIRTAVSQKIREGSIKAVRSYIMAVKTARIVTMGAFALGVVASLLVTGLVLVIVGLIGLAPTPENFPVVLIATGLVLAILAGVTMWAVFSESRWLKLSRSHELMDMALSPWPGMLPPNPIKAMKGEPVTAGPPAAVPVEKRPESLLPETHRTEHRAVEGRSRERSEQEQRRELEQKRELEERRESLEAEEEAYRRAEFVPQV